MEKTELSRYESVLELTYEALHASDFDWPIGMRKEVRILFLEKLMQHFTKKEDYRKCADLSSLMKYVQSMEECDISLFYYKAKSAVIDGVKKILLYIVDKVTNRPVRVYIYTDILTLWRDLSPAEIINRQSGLLPDINLTITFN